MSPIDSSGYRRYLSAQVSAMMIVLIAVGAVVAIPIPFSPVPIVLQNGFIVLTGVLLPPFRAAATVLLYLALGAVGLPIFAGASGGIVHLVGPSAGYLWSFPIAAVVPSLLLRGILRPDESRKIERSLSRMVPALLAGFLIPYPLGILWLSRVMEITYIQALPVGLIPFLAPDAIKLVALVFLLRMLPDSIWKNFS